MERHDPDTGEILGDDEAGGEYARNVIAADGNPQPKRSGLIADVIRMAEEGQFNLDASEEMRKLLETMERHAKQNKGVSKGRITLELDFMLANGFVILTPKFKLKEPEFKRGGTALFIGNGGSLGVNPPGQAALFGEQRKVREIGEAREVREA